MRYPAKSSAKDICLQFRRSRHVKTQNRPSGEENSDQPSPNNIDCALAVRRADPALDELAAVAAQRLCC